MGAVCCNEQEIKLTELENKQIYNPSINLKIDNSSATVSKELQEIKDQNQGEKEIKEYSQLLRIECNSKTVEKQKGDEDDVSSQLSIRSLDESSDSPPDDTKSKKTILKHQLHYIQNGQQQQVIVKKKVRFDLSKKK